MIFWIPNALTVIIAWIVQCIILGGFLWFEKLRKPDQNYTCWLIRGIRSIFFIVFTVLSFVFIDTNLKIIILCIMGYQNLSLHLASIILTFILAAELLISALIVNPNRKKIIIFAVMIVYFVYLWEFYLSTTDLNQFTFFDSKYSAAIASIFFPILVGVIAASFLTGAEFVLYKVQSKKRIVDKPFWNIQIKIKSFFDLRFNLILWGLLSAEMILNFQGMSLSFWISYLF